MDCPALRGYSILLLTDHLIHSFDILCALDQAGASMTATTSVHEALVLVAHDGPSAVILDRAMSVGDPLRQRLKERGIPCVPLRARAGAAVDVEALIGELEHLCARP